MVCLRYLIYETITFWHIIPSCSTLEFKIDVTFWSHNRNSSCGFLRCIIPSSFSIPMFLIVEGQGRTTISHSEFSSVFNNTLLCIHTFFRYRNLMFDRVGETKT